jgi:hypothetical protein
MMAHAQCAKRMRVWAPRRVIFDGNRAQAYRSNVMATPVHKRFVITGSCHARWRSRLRLAAVDRETRDT